MIFNATTIAAAKVKQQPWSSPAFVYLSTAEGEGSATLRAQLDNWCGNLPMKERNDFVARFTSYDDRIHLSAYFELVFHQFFVEEGWPVQRHPTLPKSGAKPDFHVRSPSQQFFFEVATVFQEPRLEREYRKFQQLLNEIQRIEHYFLVSLHARNWLPDDFRSADFLRFVNKSLNSLDPRTVCRNDRKMLTYRSGTYQIEIEILGRNEARKGPILGSVLYPGIGGPAGSKQVRGRIREKVKNYKDISFLDQPLIVAICSGETFWVDSEAVDYELYGKPIVTWAIGAKSSPATATRDRSGLFVPKKQDLSDPRNTRLSAVVYCKRQWAGTPDGGGRMEYLMDVYHNPWAACPLPEIVFSKLAQYVPVRTTRGISMEWRNRDPRQVLVFT